MRIAGIVFCAACFLAFGWLWTYWISLIVAYPVGIAGYLYWKRSQQQLPPAFNRVICILWIAGLMVSMVSLIATIMYN